MYFPDFHIEKAYNGRLQLVKIGWLDTQNYTKGEVSQEFLEKLKEIPFSIRTKGWHDCPFCSKAKSSNQYYIPLKGDITGRIFYDAPEMIIHYCEEHNYLPPQEFIDAVMAYKIQVTRSISGRHLAPTPRMKNVTKMTKK